MRALDLFVLLISVSVHMCRPVVQFPPGGGPGAPRNSIPKGQGDILRQGEPNDPPPPLDGPSPSAEDMKKASALENMKNSIAPPTYNPADYEEATDIPEEESNKAMQVYKYQYKNSKFHFQDHQDMWVLPQPKGLIFKHNCMRQYLKCLLSTSSPEPVCAYNNPYYDIKGYLTAASSCEIYFDNCRRGYRAWRILDTGICDFKGNDVQLHFVAKDIDYKPQYVPDEIFVIRQKRIQDVIGEEETVKKEHLPKLVYLEVAIKEAIRLYPIGPLVSRQATKEVKLGNVTLPAGSLFAVHLWAINRSERYWGRDAAEFKKSGKQYAIMHMKTTLVYILRKYHVTADHKDMEFNCYIMLRAKAGHLIRFQAR